ncbi:MAG: Mur ligase domain-containing protein, partial [Christensenellales bacterium]
MSGLATIMLKNKIKVSGSDTQNSAIINKLKKMGAYITLSHSENNITNQNLVVYSGAISMDNVELKRAEELHIPCIERSEFLGFVSSK